MERRRDLDTAKGLGILLVVFGHLVARADPAGVDWYEPLRRAVYAFHMPFFLYLSGQAAMLSGALLTPPAALKRLADSRAKRLLIPFFGVGMLIVAGKAVARPLMFVDNTGGFCEGLAALIWHTAASPAISIWYLFVLLVVTIASAGFLRGEVARMRSLLAISFMLYAMPLPAYVYLDHIGRYAVFFVLGAAAALQGERWLIFIDRQWAILLSLFLGTLGLIVIFGAAWPVWLVLLPVGALSMPALHGLVRQLPANCAGVLLWLGHYSFTIYLFNTMFIGLSKGLLLHFSSWNGNHFYGFAAALMAAGIFGPVALKYFCLRRIKPLDVLTN